MSLGGRITHLEQALSDTRRKTDSLIRINHAHEQKHQCESLYAQGRIQDAAECILEFANTVDDDVKTNRLIMDWFAGKFRRRALG